MQGESELLEFGRCRTLDVKRFLIRAEAVRNSNPFVEDALENFLEAQGLGEEDNPGREHRIGPVGLRVSSLRSKRNPKRLITVVEPRGNMLPQYSDTELVQSRVFPERRADVPADDRYGNAIGKSSLTNFPDMVLRLRCRTILSVNYNIPLHF